MRRYESHLVMSKLTHTIHSGKKTDATVMPHWFLEDGGHLRAHKTKSRNGPEGKRVKLEAKLIELVQLGDLLRIS